MATILLVDDDASFLTALERLLVQDGHRTRRAADRAAALAQAGAGDDSVDLVIADLALSDESGLGLLRELRRADPELPLIVLTAAPDASSYLEALRLGVYEYLPKPLDFAELRQVVRRALSALGRVA
jgi:DNA-binding NtrC family response regulator